MTDSQLWQITIYWKFYPLNYVAVLEMWTMTYVGHFPMGYQLIGSLQVYGEPEILYSPSLLEKKKKIIEKLVIDRENKLFML